jgi:hypothetical protein
MANASYQFAWLCSITVVRKAPTAMSTVIIRKAAYDDRVIRSIVFEMLASGEAPIIDAGCRVLIKPNFLAPAAPDKAVTTHPLIVKAAPNSPWPKGPGSRYRTARPWAVFPSC